MKQSAGHRESKRAAAATGSEKSSHHTCDVFFSERDDHSLSPDSSRRQSGLMILFTAWESSLKGNLAAAGKADRKKWLGEICLVLSCLLQPSSSTHQCWRLRHHSSAPENWVRAGSQEQTAVPSEHPPDGGGRGAPPGSHPAGLLLDGMPNRCVPPAPSPPTEIIRPSEVIRQATFEMQPQQPLFPFHTWGGRSSPGELRLGRCYLWSEVVLRLQGARGQT